MHDSRRACVRQVAPSVASSATAVALFCANASPIAVICHCFFALAAHCIDVSSLHSQYAARTGRTLDLNLTWRTWESWGGVLGSQILTMQVVSKPRENQAQDQSKAA
jgi:hypothetical protein